MNIDYNEEKDQEYSEEVRALYAFPEDKLFIKKRLNFEFFEDDIIAHVPKIKANFTAFFMAMATVAGFYHYNYLKGPDGIVLRNLRQKYTCSSRLFNRRYGAYAGLFFPVLGVFWMMLPNSSNFRD